MNDKNFDQVLRTSMRESLVASMLMFARGPDDITNRAQFSGALTMAANTVADLHNNGFLSDVEGFVEEVFTEPLDTVKELFEVALQRFYAIRTKEQKDADERTS